MSPFDSYFDIVSKELHADSEDRQRILDELRQHMAECRQEFLDLGHPEAEAERLAIERLGDARAMCTNFDAIYRTSPLKFAINLFNREKTVMHLTILRTVNVGSIVLTGGLALLSGVLSSYLVLPRVLARDHELGLAEPGIVVLYDDVSQVILRYGLVVLALLAIGGALMIRRFSGETKLHAIKTGLSLLTLAMVVWMTLGMWSMVVAEWRTESLFKQILSHSAP